MHKVKAVVALAQDAPVTVTTIITTTTTPPLENWVEPKEKERLFPLWLG